MKNLKIKEEELQEAKKEVERLVEEGKKIHVSTEPIRFVDEVPGERSNNGGEYGFFSTYYPTEVTGVYELITSTTCDFDACGTGAEGLVIMTEDEYNHLLEEEEEVLKEGSRY